MYDGLSESDRELAVVMRIARTEEWINQTERRIQILEENDMSFSKLASTLELIQQLDAEKQKHQVFIDKQQQAQMEKFSMTLDKMNGSFNRIDESMQHLYSVNRDISNKIENIESDVASVKKKVEDIEESETINWKKGLKTLGGVFITGLVAAVATYVALKMGMQ